VTGLHVREDLRYGPHDLARLLGLPPPTPQQAAVIASPPTPVLVVAGAGSGKTETMAARVVHLVANRLVRPDQVLGLTFTRKAAGELTKRVRQRLAQLAATPDFAGMRGDLTAGEPTISTYHAYAARVVSEHGVRSGFEPGTRLFTEAACWQAADAVVRSYEGDMSGVDFAVATVTKAVLELAAGLAEHLRTPAQLADYCERFAAELTSRPGRMFAAVEKVLNRQRARTQLLPLVERYAERKRDADAMDFSDQMARAATVARDHPDVGRIERDRYRVVLLDEYQDTSHAQVVLLRSLFGGGHPVTAVGDPCQSIYGWRGASAGTLERFPTDFPGPSGEPARTLPLSVSWRNRPEILDVANGLSAPLRAGDGQVLRAARPAPDGVGVRAALLGTAADEAEWLAERLAEAWWQAWRQAGPRATAAVLVRTRRQIPLIESALRARGLPVEVVGLGGLLDTPEVREISCTLRVLSDPTDGASLLRLLAGPRWRIGPRDIVALHRRARRLAEHRRRLAASDDLPLPIVTHRLDEATLTEALLDLGPAEEHSAEGHRRLRMFADELRALWSRTDQTIPDLVGDVEQTIGLDVEVAARGGDGTLARAHLDAFADVAAQFAAESETPTLSSFLAFCEAAERSERGLEPGKVEVTEGAVQLLTVHAAKGLEWDIVAVAGLCSRVFPNRQRSDHWLAQPGVLPFEMRGDAAGLPVLELGEALDQRGVRDAVEAFEQSWREHSREEERRLAYVAVTRPRWLLLCSGYWWDEASNRRGPSDFLTEVADHCRAGAGVVDGWVAEPDPDAKNPLLANPATARWPVDPFGPRRSALEEAAALVRETLVEPGSDPLPPSEEERDWAHQVDLLLAERAAAQATGPVEVALPESVTVSTLVALRADPHRLARRLRRPLPEPPNPYTRRGTAFHAWLEQRYGGERLLDLDALPGAGDADAAPDSAFEALRARFEASDWAERTPVAVEVPFTAVVAGVVLRGRMDAVFGDEDGGYQVIDWKTGRRPSGADAEAAAVQLAAYRLAWAQLAGVPVERVRAGFHYVRDNVTVRPADLLDAAALARLVETMPTGDR
jgi:DNA helicase-2/ATP-dependent DNA helicase PcrA